MMKLVIYPLLIVFSNQILIHILEEVESMAF